MPPAKKYKLFSAATGETLPCAFFAAPDGCRNGNNCKFLHVRPDALNAHSASKPDSSSVISSESEDERHVAIQHAVVSQATTANSDEQRKKKTKKRKSADGPAAGDIFAKPKSPAASKIAQLPDTKKQKLSPKNSQARAAVALPPFPIQPPPGASPPPVVGAFASMAFPSPPVATTQRKERVKRPPQQNAVPDFRSLNLPIASFSIPGHPPHTPTVVEKEVAVTPTKPQPTPLPLPKSTPTGLKWQNAVLKTRAHARYDGSYNFDKYKQADEEAGRGYASDWIKARPFGTWCAGNPQAIAIDCEMCETKDPVTGATDAKALCRISIVNADKPDEVLLDTLVKPSWPVIDYRSRINGIKAEHLENVQFTLRHAQAFLMALCSEETIILGHAVHNDLVSIKMEHHCNVDSAFLFEVKEAPNSSPSLKDLAMCVMNKEMPDTHDSVNDARTALHCLDVYLASDGNIEPIERSEKNRKSNAAMQLFVHRIPKMCQTSHLTSMFVTHTSIQPNEVDDIEFVGECGKTLVTFASTRHANLAFETLEGTEEPDKSGRLQKKVFLRNGGYVRVRKMVHPRTSNVGSPKP